MNALARSLAEALESKPWAALARPAQLPPAGKWRFWLLLGGRGAGKGRASAEWVTAEVMAGRARHVAIVGRTAADVRDVMVANGGSNSSSCRPIEVSCVRLRDIFDEYGVPFYLTVDIEGHDHYCLDDIDVDNPPPYVSVEARSADLIKALADRGYTGFKLVDQRAHYRLPLDRRLRSRIHRRLFRMVRGDVWRTGGVGPGGRWVFPRGSSGPFGEETQGPWLSLQDATARFATESQREEFWSDFHAKRAV